MRKEDQESTWRIDKHIPLAVILAIVVQSGSLVWYAAKMDSRVAVLESQMQANQMLLNQISTINSRLVRIETLIERK